MRKGFISFTKRDCSVVKKQTKKLGGTRGCQSYLSIF